MKNSLETASRKEVNISDIQRNKQSDFSPCKTEERTSLGERKRTLDRNSGFTQGDEEHSKR